MSTLTGKYSIIFNDPEEKPENKSFANIDRPFDEDEIPTEKMPIQTVCELNNTPIIYDDPIAITRIILLQSKPEYEIYYSQKIFAIYLRTENSAAWFGPPVKNPNLGPVRWNKSEWNRIYDFTMSLTLKEI